MTVIYWLTLTVSFLLIFSSIYTVCEPVSQGHCTLHTYPFCILKLHFLFIHIFVFKLYSQCMFTPEIGYKSKELNLFFF